MTDGTVARLRTLDASSIERRPAARALLIGRDDIPFDARIAQRLTELGTETKSVRWSGYEAMMRDPQDMEIPVATVESMIDWLRSTVKVNRCSIAPGGPLSGTEGPRLEGPGYSEEPHFSATNPVVFGILTLPQRGVDAALPMILLLSVGANPHIGPNRMYVTLARQFAVAGYASLRLDVPGIGDSACGSESPRERIYSAAASESVRAVIQDLQGFLGECHFLLIGLCSGAYAAYEVAVDAASVAGQVLINPQTYEWTEGDSIEVRMRESYKMTRHYTSALRDPATLRRIWKRQVDTRGIASILWKRLRGRIALAARSVKSPEHGRRFTETPVCRNFRRISDRGTRTLFLFSDNDFGIEATEVHLGANARKIRGYGTVEHSVLPGSDHTFTSKKARDKMISHILDYAVRTFPPRRRLAD